MFTTNSHGVVQGTFSGKELFSWVKQEDGRFWYEFDYEEAVKKGRKDRDAEARRFKSKGYKVKKFALGTQLLKKGGIGTPYPEIDYETKGYGFNAYPREG